jgi:hypothetical protein
VRAPKAGHPVSKPKQGHVCLKGRGPGGSVEKVGVPFLAPRQPPSIDRQAPERALATASSFSARSCATSSAAPAAAAATAASRSAAISATRRSMSASEAFASLTSWRSSLRWPWTSSRVPSISRSWGGEGGGGRLRRRREG